MVQSKQRTKLLAVVLALVAIAAIVALSLSLRAQAADLEIFNVYVGDAAQAEAFASANAADTGYDASVGFTAPRHQVFASVNEAQAGITAAEVTAEMAKYNKDNVRANMWILEDTENTNTANNNGVFGSAALFRVKFLDSARAEDVMLYVTGVKGYGSVAGDHPLVLSSTHANNYCYFYTATTLKNITIKINKDFGTSTDKNFIFMQGHEFVADEGVQINNYDGTPLRMLISSGYTGVTAREAQQCFNGFGTYNNTYVEDGFAGKITLRSGNWDGIVAAYGHPGVNRTYTSGTASGNAQYDFSETRRGDYYITVEGTAAAKTLSAGKYGGTSFLGGENCSVNYLIRGNAMVTDIAGAYSTVTCRDAKPGGTANDDSYSDNTRQYFDLNVTVEDGPNEGEKPIIGSILIYNIQGSATYPTFFLGDITLNLKGGIYDMAYPALLERGYGKTNGETNIRAVQGSSEGAPANIYLGKITMNIGDPVTGKGPSIGETHGSNNPIAGNNCQGIFRATLGIGTGTATVTDKSYTYTGAYANLPIFKTGVANIVAPAENPTMAAYAAEHAGFEFNMYGGEVESFVAPLCAKTSLGTDVNIYGGTLNALSFTRQHAAADASTVARLNVNVEGGTVGTYTGFGYAVEGEYNLTVGKAGQTQLADGEAGGVIKNLKRMAGYTTVVCDISFTVQGCGKVENLTTLLDAADGNSSVSGNLNILLKDNAQITQFGSFLLPSGTAGTKNCYVGGSKTNFDKQEFGENAKGDLNFTMKDNALIQATVTDESKTWTHTAPAGIYLFGGLHEKTTSNYVTYCLGNVTMNFDGGTIRCINDSTNLESVIFLGGLNFIVKGNVTQNFRGGVTIENVKTETSGGTVSGIFTACNSTTWENDYTVVMEDCNFSSFASKPVYLSGKTTTGIFGTRSTVMGTADGSKFPTFTGVSCVYVNCGWGVVGNSTQTVPAEAKDEIVARNTVYNIKTDGDLAFTAANAVNSKKIYSFMNGNMVTTITGGTVGGKVYLANSGMTLGNVSSTITGGTFGTIELGQCRKTHTVDIDLTKTAVKTITGSHRNISTTVFSSSGGQQLDYEVPGDLELTLRNWTPDETALTVFSGKYTGDVTLNWIGGSSASGGGIFYAVKGGSSTSRDTLTGNLSFNATDVSFYGTVAPVYQYVTVAGDVSTTLSGCTLDSNFFGAGISAVTINGNVTSTLKDNTVLTGKNDGAGKNGKFYGGLQTGDVNGNITNNLENVTIYGQYVGGNGASTNSTATVNNIVNNVTGLTLKGNTDGTTLKGMFYGGSEWGTVKGSVTNNVSDSATATFYGGNVQSATSIAKGIVNNISKLSLVTAENNTDTDPQTMFYAAGSAGTVSAGGSDYAVYTRIDGMWGDCGIALAGNSVNVNGDIKMDAWDVDMNQKKTGRHLMLGNGQFASNSATPTWYLIDGNVEANIYSGTYGVSFLGSRSTRNTQEAIKNNTQKTVSGNVTMNIYGGSFGSINKGLNDINHNIGGKDVVNVYTTQADVTLRGSIGTVSGAETKPVTAINLIAGEYTLYKSGSASLEFDSFTGGTLKFAPAADWADGVAHLTIKGGNFVDQVNAENGPSSVLTGAFTEGNSVWSGISYAINVEDISRVIVLGDTYTVRYLLPKEKVDWFGMGNVGVAYVTINNGETGESITVELLDGAKLNETDYSGYYYFEVAGIHAKDYERVEFTVTITTPAKATVLENDSIAIALEDLAEQDDSYKGLSEAIKSYAAALEAYFYADEELAYPEIKGEDRTDFIMQHTSGKTNSSVTLAEGVKASGVSVSVTDVLTIHFWIEANSEPQLEKAILTNASGNEDIADTLRSRGNGYYTLSYTCGAGDLANLLELDLGGSVTFSASPLSYADTLSKMAGYENLGAAIIEYAYYVQTVLVEG